MAAKLHGIATSDWHLDALKSHFPHDHVDRQISVLEKIFKYAIENGIGHVFVNGDVFDSSSSPMKTCVKLLRLLCKYNEHVDIHILAGNHDWSDIHTIAIDFLAELIQLRMLKRVFIYKDSVETVINGINVNFIPYGSEYIDRDKPSLNFTHGDIKGVVGDNGRPIKKVSSKRPPKGDFTIAGHNHLFQFLEKERFLCNGSPYQKTFGETPTKGFVEFTASYKSKSKLKVDYRFIRIRPLFEFKTIFIEKQKDFDKLSNSYSIRLRLIIKGDVIIPPDLNKNYPNIAQILDAKGKKVSETCSSVEIASESLILPEINPTLGLSTHLKAQGFGKSQRKLAKLIVGDALAVSKIKY